MMEKIIWYIDTFLTHLIKENPEGILFYMFGSCAMTWVLIKNKDEFKKGLKGHNGLWEAPEIVIYMWLWMFTQSIMAVLFLKLDPPDMFWWFMFLCLMFSLAGRDGIQMLFNWRGSSSTTMIQKESTSETTVINNEAEQQDKN